MFSPDARSILGLAMLCALEFHGASPGFTKEPPAVEASQPLAAVISALEQEERKYRDIDYSSQTTAYRFDSKNADAPAERILEETQHVVLQGSLFRFRHVSTPLVF